MVSAVGIYDVLQKRHAILRNYPILAHFRFFFETIRPEIRQYLLEGDHEAVPFSRAQRSGSRRKSIPSSCFRSCSSRRGSETAARR